MSRWLWWGFAAAIALWGYLVLTAAPTPDVSRATETARVVRIIDGDTVVLDDGRKVRYLGIDAPEISQAPFDPYGPEAFSLNDELVENRQVKLEYDLVRQDSHGRALAFVYVRHEGHWICVNAELVRRGLARVLFIPPNERYKKYLRKLEQGALRARRGLWSMVTERPAVITAHQAEEEFNNYRWQWVTVRFQVVGTYHSSAIVRLDSAEDPAGHFSAVIFSGDLDRFQGRGIDPESYYKGKIIEVTGFLKEYHGPEIIIERPGQIRTVAEAQRSGYTWPSAMELGELLRLTTGAAGLV